MVDRPGRDAETPSWERCRFGGHQTAIAIYAAKQQARSLPPDAGIRYFAGIARFFGAKHPDLLDWLVDRLDAPARPAKSRRPSSPERLTA